MEEKIVKAEIVEEKGAIALTLAQLTTLITQIVQIIQTTRTIQIVPIAVTK